ncbi:hypothetical protein ABE10_00710, partial [Bacillus toyonensis]|nr:hypothetical protein [Bacillus toyonensis]
RAGDADALLHPPRELGRELVAPPVEADHAEDLLRTRSPLRLRDALELQGVCDIRRDRPVGEQREVLEHHRDPVATDLAQPAGGDAGDHVAVQRDLSVCRLMEAVEHADDRGLPGSRETHDDEDLTAVDGEARVDDGGGAVSADVGTTLPGLQPADGLARILPEHLVQMARFQSGFGHVSPMGSRGVEPRSVTPGWRSQGRFDVAVQAARAPDFGSVRRSPTVRPHYSEMHSRIEGE